MMDYLFRLEGRLNRARYWLAALIYVIALVIGWGIAILLAGGGGFVILGLIYLAVVVSSVLVARLRLHDRDKSSWWLLLFYLAPSVLSAAARGYGYEGGLVLPILLHLAALAIAVWAFIELGCLRGTPGPNRFGPDPLATPAAAVAAG
jgi:uncharacterized membrane protein YhaH (DUF805 family)